MRWWNFILTTMERKRLQQQRLKQQQQRICLSQQDLTEALARMRPTERDERAAQSSSMSNSVSSSVDALTIPSVSQLIKDFESRATSTPFESTEELLSLNKPTIPNRRRRASSSLSKTNDNLHSNASTRDHHQPVFSQLSSSTSSSYHSFDVVVVTDAVQSKQQSPNVVELRRREKDFNNALADLISLSNDADISSSISSASSRSLIHRPHRSSTSQDRSQSISVNIALLNNLLDVLSLDQGSTALKPKNQFCQMLSDNRCANCHQAFAADEQIVNAAGQIWHTQCFVCAQCFQSFERGIYFEHENRKYCEQDFQMLFAPCCAECKQAIVGRVIRALQKCFHPDCFRCHSCHTALLEIGFAKNNDRALCRECNSKEKAKDANVSQQMCSTCQQRIDHQCLKYQGQSHHAYHFQCASCRSDLDENAREVRGSLYCPSCQHKLDLPVCGACRRLIDDRVISALGKQWHVEHFCCARCAQPFRGSKHFENKGLAYCETDYHFLFGSTCFNCNRIITEGAYTACNKKYCAEHFACSMCECKMNEKSKFFDVDATPVCKGCYGKLPSQSRKSVQQYQKKKPVSSIFKQNAV